MKLVEEILARIRNSEDLEQILKECNWQTFEEFVAWVLEQFDYKTKLHYRFGDKKKYEIDVLAEKNNICLLIECKKWKGKTQTSYKLKKEVKKHLERIEAFRRKQKKKCEGFIVTLLDYPIEIEGIKVIPIARLNKFLLRFY